MLFKPLISPAEEMGEGTEHGGLLWNFSKTRLLVNRQDLGSDLMGGQDAGSALHRSNHYSRRRGSPRVWRAVDAGDGPRHTSGPQAAISFLMPGGVRTAAWVPEGSGPGSVPEGGTAKCCWEEQCPRPGPVRGRGCDQGPHGVLSAPVSI